MSESVLVSPGRIGLYADRGAAKATGNLVHNSDLILRSSKNWNLDAGTELVEMETPNGSNRAIKVTSFASRPLYSNAETFDVRVGDQFEFDLYARVNGPTKKLTIYMRRSDSDLAHLQWRDFEVTVNGQEFVPSSSTFPLMAFPIYSEWTHVHMRGTIQGPATVRTANFDSWLFGDAVNGQSSTELYIAGFQLRRVGGAQTALELTSTRQSFHVGGKEVAYIDSLEEAMVIRNVRVTDQVKVGSHAIERYSDHVTNFKLSGW